MNKITIVADMVAEDDKIDFVKAELIALAKITQGEEGCIQYDLQEDQEKPAHFIMFEVWENAKLLEKHSNNKPLQDFQKKTDGALASFSICTMKHIS